MAQEVLNIKLNVDQSNAEVNITKSSKAVKNLTNELWKLKDGMQKALSSGDMAKYDQLRDKFNYLTKGAGNVSNSMATVGKASATTAKQVDKTSTSVNNLNSKMDNQNKSGMNFKNISAGMVAAYAAIAMAIKAVSGAVKESVVLFLVQDTMNQKVGTQFGNYAKSINDAANATQALTTVGNEQYQKLALQAKSLGVENTNVNKTVKDSIGLSTLWAERGITQQQVIEGLAKANAGNWKAMNLLYPELKNVTDQTEKMNIINDLAAKGFKEAEKYANTFEGKIKQIKNAYGDMQEVLGGQILSSVFDIEGGDNIIDTINKITEALDKTQFIAKYLGNMREQAEMMMEPFMTLFSIFGEGGSTIDGLNTILNAYFKIISVLQIPIKLVWSNLSAVAGVIKDLIHTFKNLKEFKIQDVFDIWNRAVVKLFTPITDVIGLTDDFKKFFGVAREESTLSAEELEKYNKLLTNTKDLVKDIKAEYDKTKSDNAKKILDDEEAAKLLEESNKLTEEKLAITKAATDAYNTYTSAITAANEQAALDVANGDSIQVARKKQIGSIYSATEAYYKLNGLTQSEIDKLVVLKKMLNNFTKLDKITDFIGGIDDAFNKQTTSPFDNFIPRDEQAKKIILEAENFGKQVSTALNVAMNSDGTGEEKASVFIEKLFQISPESAQDILNAATQTAMDIGNAISTIRNNKLQEQFDFENAAINSRYDMELARAGDNEEKKLAIQKRFENERSVLAKKQAKERQKEAITQAIINGALAIGAAAAQSPWPIVAPIMMALAAASTGAQIAVIKSQKFAKGGILKGPSHANGGIKTPFGEMEGGESVINKKSTSMYGDLLSAINVSGGGAPIANNPQPLIDYNLLAAAMQSQKVYVVSSEVTKQQSRDAKISDRARF